MAAIYRSCMAARMMTNASIVLCRKITIMFTLLIYALHIQNLAYPIKQMKETRKKIERKEVPITNLAKVKTAARFGYGFH